MDSTATILWPQLPIAIVGILFCGLGGYWLWTILSFWRRAERVSGVVTELRTRRKVRIGDMNLRTNGQLSYPVVQFTTHEGRDVETTTYTAAQPMPARPGDETTVLYDPTDPTFAELTVWYRVSLGLMFLILGLVPVFLSVPGLWQGSLDGRLFMAGLFGGLALPFTLLGGTTLSVALRVKRIGYSIFGGLFLGIGLLLLWIFRYILFGFGG